DLTFTTVEPVRPTIEFLPDRQPVAHPAELPTSSRTPPPISPTALRVAAPPTAPPPVGALPPSSDLLRAPARVCPVLLSRSTRRSPGNGHTLIPRTRGEVRKAQRRVAARAS